MLQSVIKTKKTTVQVELVVMEEGSIFFIPNLSSVNVQVKSTQMLSLDVFYS